MSEDEEYRTSSREDDKRRKQEMHAASDPIAALMRELGAPETIAKMSDADWDEHDRKVREAIHIREHGAPPTMRWSELGWPERHALAAPQAARREAVLKLDAWDWRRRCVAILLGAKGCGKTLAAAVWALKRSAEGQLRTQFARAYDLSTLSRYDQATRERWYLADAMVLDDLGGEYQDAGGNFESLLDALIDRFYSAMKPLVITTNLSIEDIQARYSERVSDRFVECAQIISIGEQSLRGGDIIDISTRRRT